MKFLILDFFLERRAEFLLLVFEDTVLNEILFSNLEIHMHIYLLQQTYFERNQFFVFLQFDLHVNF